MKKVENASEREGVIFNEVNILKRLKHVSNNVKPLS